MTAVGVAIGVTAVASASVPSLPHRTVAQLLADVGQAAARPIGPLTATVQETASLGLPALPVMAQPAAGSGLVAGTQSISIWYRDPQHIRLAQPTQSGESDLRLDGRTAWLWSSSTQTATRLALPAHLTGLPGGGIAPRRGPLAGSGSLSSVPDSPMAAANAVLKAVGPTTVVSDQTNAYVAGRSAYQISLVPKSSKSLVGKVLIAIDSSRLIPLRVQVYGRGSVGLAYSVGFSALKFGPPAASNFSFTPPPGATVKKQTVPGNLQTALRQAGIPAAALSGLGTASGTTATKLPKAVQHRFTREFRAGLPKGMTAAQRAKALRALTRSLNKGELRGGPVSAPLRAAGSSASKPLTIGSGWLSVVATPASPAVAAAVRQLLSGHQTAPQSSSTSTTSGSGAYSSTLTIKGPLAAGPQLAGLGALLRATTAVHGSWGSGRLLQTKLLTVLVTSKGQVLAGAVTPAVLYADVAVDTLAGSPR